MGEYGSPYKWTLEQVGNGFGTSVRVGNYRLDLGVMAQGNGWRWTIEVWANQKGSRTLRKIRDRAFLKQGIAANMLMVQKEFDAVIDQFVDIVRTENRGLKPQVRTSYKGF